LASKSYFNIQHPIKLSPQPTGMTCWSAATTMLFGTTFTAGPGKAELSEDGGLLADSTNIATFAHSYNLRMYYPQTWSVDGLVQLLKRGPVALMGAIPSLHAVVIGGISGDGTPSGTELTIYDPWPPNIGGNPLGSRFNYEVLLQRFPLATMYLLQR